MTSLQFTVSETIYRRFGEIIEITYDYNEIRTEQVEDNMQTKQEKFEKNYHASFKRYEYENLAKRYKYQRDVLPFDIFVKVLRPFMMGTYTSNDEIREVFRLLDKNYSRTIDSDELFAFIPVIHPYMTKETVVDYINKVSQHGNIEIDFNGFVQMILRGIGRDIVCGHVYNIY